jgi:hypothetical protein
MARVISSAPNTQFENKHPQFAWPDIAQGMASARSISDQIPGLHVKFAAVAFHNSVSLQYQVVLLFVGVMRVHSNARPGGHTREIHEVARPVDFFFAEEPLELNQAIATVGARFA